MSKLGFAGVAIVALVAVPALAIAGPHGPPRPMTRAMVEARVKGMFAHFDANRDGQVTRAEFDAATAKNDATREQHWTEHRREQFAKLDTDHNGQLSPAEFDARPDFPERGEHGGGVHGGMGGEWFDEIAGDKGGAITVQQATSRALAKFDAADANHDGTLSPEEMQHARF